MRVFIFILFPNPLFMSIIYQAFQTFDESDKETWPDQPIFKDKEIEKHKEKHKHKIYEVIGAVGH